MIISLNNILITKYETRHNITISVYQMRVYECNFPVKQKWYFFESMDKMH